MKKRIRAIVIMLVFASVVLGVYYKMNQGTLSKTEEVEVPQTTVEKLLARDLENEYPATAKAVMKAYSEYSKCFYDGEYTEDEFVKLFEQYRMLLDDELIANNPTEEHLKTLKNEVLSFQEEGKTIFSYYWPDSKAVTYYTKSERKYASTDVCYTMKKGTSTVEESKQKFVLRQDAEGKWKILGWGRMNK